MEMGIRLTDTDRQSVIIARLEAEGRYSEYPEGLADSLRTLKALQILLQEDRAAILAHDPDADTHGIDQPLADVTRLAKSYIWLTDPANADHPQYTDQMKWTFHAMRDLVSASRVAEQYFAARQEVLL